MTSTRAVEDLDEKAGMYHGVRNTCVNLNRLHNAFVNSAVVRYACKSSCLFDEFKKTQFVLALSLDGRLQGGYLS